MDNFVSFHFLTKLPMSFQSSVNAIPQYDIESHEHDGIVGVVVPRTVVTRLQSPGSAYRQFGFMPKMKVHTYHNSQKVTAASV